MNEDFSTTGLSADQIEFVTMCINAQPPEGVPFATAENLRFFRAAFVYECVRAAVKLNLADDGKKMAAEILEKGGSVNYIERECIFEHAGHKFESGGAVITENVLIAYFSHDKARREGFDDIAKRCAEIKIVDKSRPSFGKEGKVVFWKVDGVVKTYNAAGVRRVENGGTTKINIHKFR